MTQTAISPKASKSHLFQPGKSGNPLGRPKSDIGAMVRQLHGNGERLTHLFTEIAFCEGQFQGARIPLTVRMEAANWLADRGWGKPSQVTDIRVDIEQRILTLAADLGLDPQEAASEMARVIETKG